jgi:hypothetical protein
LNALLQQALEFGFKVSGARKSSRLRVPFQMRDVQDKSLEFFEVLNISHQKQAEHIPFTFMLVFEVLLDP